MKDLVPSWSYSTLKLYDQCPYRYFREKVKKDIKTEFSGPAAEHGVDVHRRFEQRLTMGRPLPKELADYEQLCERLQPCNVERDLAVDVRLQPVGWYDNVAWGRARLDVVKVDDDRQEAIVVDWKTGKVRYDVLQPIVSAFILACHEPSIRTVKTRWVYVDHGVAKEETFVLEDDLRWMWREIKDRLQDIAMSAKHDSWPTRESALCTWCPVEDCHVKAKIRKA